MSTMCYQHLTYRTISILRGSLVNLIYDKILDHGMAEVGSSGSVSLITADMDRVAHGLRNLQDVWGSLAEVLLTLWLLWTRLNITGLAPLVLAFGISQIPSPCNSLVMV